MRSFAERPIGLSREGSESVENIFVRASNAADERFRLRMPMPRA